MKRFLLSLGKKFNGNDLLIFGGLLCLGVGIGLVSVSGALVTVGGIVFLVGLLGAMRAG